MTAGIVSYGAYVPIYRLSRQEIAKMWGGGYRKGEKAVANSDEDSLTMGVAAARDCLKGFDSKSVDGLYFASVSAPYREKQTASIIAAALDLRPDAFTSDFSNSLGSGADALKAAQDAVNAGRAGHVLVVAADSRLPPPNSMFERMLGDGAAALLIGKDDVAVSIEGQYGVSSDFLDIWKKDRNDTYMRTWEDRFILDKGYLDYVKKVVDTLLKNQSLSPKEIAKAAYYGPDPRSHGALGRRMGFSPEQIQSPMFDELGNTGTPFFMMILVAALENASPGDRILAASYGDGSDAFLLRAEDTISNIQDRRGMKRHLESKMALSGYGKYVRYRDLMEWEGTPMPPAESSDNVFYREEKALIRGYGHLCRSCGKVQFPPQRICMWCQDKDQFDDVRIVDKQGKLFTYSMDDRAVFALDLPNIHVIADLEGGGRIYNQATDRDPDKMEVGMALEFTFRKFHEASGFHNYSWKLQPVRC